MKKFIEENSEVRLIRDFQNGETLIPKGTIGIVICSHPSSPDEVLADFEGFDNMCMKPSDCFMAGVCRDRDFELVDYYDPIAECRVPAPEYESESYVSKPREKEGET